MTVSRLLQDGGAGAAGLLDAAVDVGHLEGDVDDAVTVLRVVGDERAVGADGALDDEADRAGLQDERLVVADAVLRAGVGDELHAPGALVVVRGLGGVADDEHEGVPAGDRERVLLLVVLDEADELLELLEVQAAWRSCSVRSRWLAGVVVVSVIRPLWGFRARCATVRRSAGQGAHGACLTGGAARTM